MNRRTLAIVLAVGFATALAPRLAFAEDHVAEAVSHTKEAIDEGKQGHAKELTTHAEAALNRLDELDIQLRHFPSCRLPRTSPLSGDRSRA